MEISLSTPTSNGVASSVSMQCNHCAASEEECDTDIGRFCCGRCTHFITSDNPDVPDWFLEQPTNITPQMHTGILQIAKELAVVPSALSIELSPHNDVAFIHLGGNVIAQVFETGRIRRIPRARENPNSTDIITESMIRAYERMKQAKMHRMPFPHDPIHDPLSGYVWLHDCALTQSEANDFDRAHPEMVRFIEKMIAEHSKPTANPGGRGSRLMLHKNVTSNRQSEPRHDLVKTERGRKVRYTYFVPADEHDKDDKMYDDGYAWDTAGNDAEDFFKELPDEYEGSVGNDGTVWYVRWWKT